MSTTPVTSAQDTATVAGTWWRRPPFRDRRFWLVQLLVVGLTAGHTAIEAGHALGALPDLYLLPVSLFFVPMVYAGLSFGRAGAVPTAVWCCALITPEVLLFHHGWGRVGVAFQVAIMVAIAIIIAARVDREQSERRRAEAASAQLTELNTSLRNAQDSLQHYVRLATDAQEEERKRLARELHDDTLQTLATIKGDLDSVVGDTDLPGATRERLQRSRATLTGAIDSVRRFSRDLRPSILDDLGLADAVDWLVKDTAARTGIAITLNATPGLNGVAADTALAAYRIVQEALRNVERHARAHHAGVELRLEAAALVVSVTDDGVGFDPTATAGSAGAALGLIGMDERAKLAGGRLQVRSRPGEGASVTATIPAAAPPGERQDRGR